MLNDELNFFLIIYRVDCFTSLMVLTVEEIEKDSAGLVFDETEEWRVHSTRADQLQEVIMIIRPGVYGVYEL